MSQACTFSTLMMQKLLVTESETNLPELKARALHRRWAHLIGCQSRLRCFSQSLTATFPNLGQIGQSPTLPRFLTSWISWTNKLLGLDATKMSVFSFEETLSIFTFSFSGNRAWMVDSFKRYHVISAGKTNHKFLQNKTVVASFFE